ncbi:monothiol glutaredoxin, partial [Phenoliferia sp. Uapishka_3]
MQSRPSWPSDGQQFFSCLYVSSRAFGGPSTDWREHVGDDAPPLYDCSLTHPLDSPSRSLLQIEAESLPDISESFEVDAVPYFILLRGHTLLTRLSGAQPSVLSAALTSHAAKPSPLSSTAQKPQELSTTYNGEKELAGGDNDESEEELVKRCEELMVKTDVVLFMKGDKETPRCGFSQKIIGILDREGVEFSTFDILSDDGVRQKLKEINTWPTFPQLIIKGEFVGGLDVVSEMVENGELKEMLA